LLVHFNEFLNNPPQQVNKRIASLDTKAVDYLLGKKV